MGQASGQVGYPLAGARDISPANTVRNHSASGWVMLGIVVLASACGSSDHAPPLQRYKGTGGRPVTASGGSGNGEDASAASSGGSRSSGGSTAKDDAGGASLVDAAAPAGVKARVVGDGLYFPVLRIDSHGDIIVAGTTVRGPHVAVGKTFDGDRAGIFVGKYRADDFSPVYQKVFRPKGSPANVSSLSLGGLALGANDEMYLQVAQQKDESVDFGGGDIQGTKFVVTLSSAAEFVRVNLFEGSSSAYGISVDSDGALVFGVEESVAFNLNGLVLPPLEYSGSEALSGSAGAAKYSSDALTGTWVTRLANPQATLTRFARPDGTGKIALVGGNGGGLFLATLEGSSGAIVMEKQFETDNNGYFNDIARVGDTYVVAGNTVRKLTLDGHVVLKEDGLRQTAFVGSFSLSDGATRWVHTVDSPGLGFPLGMTASVEGTRVAAMKDSTFAVLFTQLVFTSSPTDPRACQTVASIHRYDASGSLLDQRTLRAGSWDTCAGEVRVFEMAAEADGSLILYGASTGLPYLQKGIFLMRLEK